MILLSGPSASGKTEVAKMLKLLFGIQKAVTHTTRSPRKGEKNAIDYFFVSKERFLELKKQDFFVETTFYNQNYYGCGKDQISPAKVVVVDPNGLKSFLALNNRGVVSFFLKAKEETRIKRMRNRGDSEEAIASRISNDRIEFASNKIPPTDFQITTDDLPLEGVAQEVYKLYLAALQKQGISLSTASK